MLGRTYENYRMVSNMCQAHAPNTDKSDFLKGRVKGKDQKNEFGTTMVHPWTRDSEPEKW